ncbi:MAG: hypothetical protein Q8R11_02890 [bacterium]|nr:hypothetical protein [bacterium]
MRRLFILITIFLLSALAFPVGAQQVFDPIKDYESQRAKDGVNFANWSSTSVEYLMLKAGTMAIGTTDGRELGAVQGLGGAMTAMYTNPAASTQTYLADVLNGMGVPSAYAQGTGFQGLQQIIHIWKVFRNIAYIFFVMIFLAVGFLVMFRFRIDPRTVVTIQNSLPRIILALLLVTFSFAIAGFLIDVMYVVSFLFFNIFQSIPGMETFAGHIRNDFQSETPFTLWAGSGIGPSAPAQAIYTIATGIFGGAPFLAGFGGSVLSIIAWLVIAIGLVFVMFRLFFTLLMAYIQIILGVVFAPFWIMLGGLPLNLGNLGFGGWLRHMIGNLAAFPTAAGMFILSSAFMNQAVFSAGGTNAGQGWVAPMIGAGYGQNEVAALIGLGFVFLTPAVVKMTKDAFKSPEFKYGGVISAGVGAGVAPMATAVRFPFSIWTQSVALGMAQRGPIGYLRDRFSGNKPQPAPTAQPPEQKS